MFIQCGNWNIFSFWWWDGVNIASGMGERAQWNNLKICRANIGCIVHGTHKNSSTRVDRFNLHEPLVSKQTQMVPQERSVRNNRSSQQAKYIRFAWYFYLLYDRSVAWLLFFFLAPFFRVASSAPSNLCKQKLNVYRHCVFKFHTVLLTRFVFLGHAFHFDLSHRQQVQKYQHKNCSRFYQNAL